MMMSNYDFLMNYLIDHGLLYEEGICEYPGGFSITVSSDEGSTDIHFDEYGNVVEV